ncbi:MAG: hypothetical protein E7496_02895 [Ruminococcus sp.]|nr:hypothetical protein [Ruminococcus sp.]
MEIIKYPSEERVNEGIRLDEPMLAAISFDGKKAIISQVEDSFEHHIMLSQAGYSQLDIDKFFRIVFDRTEANWTFVCPSEYKNIQFKDYRIKAFYKDGYAAISDFLQEIGYLIQIKIPSRYSRHLKMITDESATL